MLSVTSKNSPEVEVLGMLAGNHLDTAQSQASSHSSLHILILKLVQEAQQSLDKGEMLRLRPWKPSILTLPTRESCKTHPFPEDGTK